MRKAWIAAIAFAAGTLVVLRGGGCLSEDPDQKLAGRFEAMCEIAADGIDHPVRGIMRLGRYLGRHTDDLLAEFGATIQLIERIDDDDEHDARARLARTRLHKPLHECEHTWGEFFEAVEDNPEAKKILERGLDRLGRTLEIIFDEDARLDVERLPAGLMKRLEAVTARRR